MMVAFLQEVEGFRIRQDLHDQWIWTAEPSDNYSARSAYKVTREGISGEGQDEGYKDLWYLQLYIYVYIL